MYVQIFMRTPSRNLEIQLQKYKTQLTFSINDIDRFAISIALSDGSFMCSDMCVAFRIKE